MPSLGFATAAVCHRGLQQWRRSRVGRGCGCRGCCSSRGPGRRKAWRHGEQSGVFASEDVWLALVSRQCDRSVEVGTLFCRGKHCGKCLMTKSTRNPSTLRRAEARMYEWAGVHG